MNITNRETIEMINVLSGLQNKVLPIKLSFAIGKNEDILNTQIYKPYFKELEKLKEKYPEKDGVRVDREAFAKELEELLSVENEVTLHTIKEELLDICDQNERYSALSAKEAIALMKMLDKPVDEKKEG